MFSSRLNWDLRPNPLSALLDRKRAAGARILDLTESNPTRAGFIYPTEEILAALTDPAALRYDPAPRGLFTARESIASYYAARDRAVAPDQILLAASTSEAYAYLFKLLCDSGDEILTPRPSYPLFEFLAELDSVRVRQYPLRYDGAWRIDFSALEATLTDRSRAVVVVNPNNPTGSFLAPDESDRLQALAAARGIAILIDEVFSDYRFVSAARPQRLQAQALTFSMSGLSKVVGLPQMKLGWIVADGPGREVALDRLELIADTYLSVATPVQLALPRLLVTGDSIRSQILNRSRSNLTRLRSITRGTACHVLNVDGGWYAVLQIPRTRSEESWALTFLADDDVLIQPGFFFDFESEAFLVASLIAPPEIFEEGIRRIVARIDAPIAQG